MNSVFSTFRKQAKLQFATILVLTASFAVISGVMLVTTNAQKILTLWGESMQMSVYLSEDSTPEHLSAVQKYLQENTNIDKLKFVKKEDALLQFRDQMASYAPDLMDDRDLLKFIPASFQFSMSKNVRPTEQLQAMKDLAVQLQVQPGVEEVSYGQDWIKSYSAITSGLEWVGGLFIGIIFVSAGFVMSNSIQSSIQQRRTEIEVLELIGVTSQYIRKPFLIEAAILAGTSCIFALALSYGLFASMLDYLKNQASFLQLTQALGFLSPSYVGGLFVFAVGLGTFSAWLCVSKINTGWAANFRSKKVRA